MAVMLSDARDGAHEIGRYVAIHVSDVNVDDAHRHAGDPGRSVGADLFLQ
jgi:hypothetical protein